jgi:threonyl-tRNA synthetase
LGTHERFIGFLIEHYGGNFPLWLAPVQVKIIPVTEAQHDIARNIHDSLRNKMIRSEVDLSPINFGKKVRNAKNARIPYFIIIGDKDMAMNKITLESRDKGQVGQMSAEEMTKKLENEIVGRK